MSDTEFSRAGLGYKLWVPDLSTELRIGHLRRSSGELSGDLTIRAKIGGVKTVDGVLHAARFNLSSSTARERLAATLKKRTPEVGTRIDWFELLEELAQRTNAAEERGEPVEEVGHILVEDFGPKFAVDPLVPLGESSLLYAPGGSGKSVLALTDAVSIAAGREIIPGIAPAIKGNALYLDWETRKEVANLRIQAICRGGGFPVPHGLFYRRMSRPLSAVAEEMAAAVAERDIVFVVVDSASQAIGPQGEHGDANEGALRLFEAIRYLGGGVSTQIVDHVAKEEIRDGGKRGRMPYGSVAKINQARRAWELRKGEPAPDGALRVSLRDAKVNDDAEHPEIGLRIIWKPGSISFESDIVSPVSYAQPDETPISTSAKISELLEGARMKAPDIARTLNLNPDLVRVTLNRDSRFEKDANGYWITARDHIGV